MDCKDTSVLIVDDEKEISSLLKKVFEEEGCYVGIVSSIEESRKMLEDTVFSLILLDLKFPGDDSELSGLCYIKELKTRYPNMGVIVITGNSSQEATIEALNNGADGFILKPFQMSLLFAMISDFKYKRAEMDFKEALQAASFRALRAYKIEATSLRQASIEAKNIIDEGNANGVIIEAFIKEKNAVRGV